MDLNEYISSGILENYVLGTTSDQERQEVECLAHIYPEIKEALTILQTGIEKMAISVAVEPSQKLRAKVMDSIRSTPQEKEDGETKVVPLKAVKKRPMYPLLAAASIALLVGLGIYTLYLKSDFDSVETQLATTTTTLEELQADYDNLDATNTNITDQMAFIEDQMAFLRNQNTKKIQLSGAADQYADNVATIFWNNESEIVMLDVQNLPATTTEESYQLWVLVGGEPKDMGVFDFNDPLDTAGLLKMKTTGEADAFAITREPFGGSESPTLENLHVIGTI